MENPYVHIPAEAPRPNPQAGKTLALVGAFLQLGVVVGVILAMIGMAKAYQALSRSSARMSDPSEESVAIGHVLVPAAIGGFLGLLGFVLLLVALLGKRYRAQWFYWFLTTYGSLLVVGFPYGTPFGLILVICALVFRKEFFREKVSRIDN